MINEKCRLGFSQVQSRKRWFNMNKAWQKNVPPWLSLTLKSSTIPLSRISMLRHSDGTNKSRPASLRLCISHLGRGRGRPFNDTQSPQSPTVEWGAALEIDRKLWQPPHCLLCLPACLSVCLSDCQPVWPPACLTTCLCQPALHKGMKEDTWYVLMSAKRTVGRVWLCWPGIYDIY